MNHITIETPRLILKGISPEDMKYIFENLTKPEKRYIPICIGRALSGYPVNRFPDSPLRKGTRQKTPISIGAPSRLRLEVEAALLCFR